MPAFDAEREGGGGAGVLCGMGVVALRPLSLCESKEGTRLGDLLGGVYGGEEGVAQGLEGGCVVVEHA